MKNLSLVDLLVVHAAVKPLVLLLAAGVQLSVALEATLQPLVLGAMSRRRRQKVTHLMLSRHYTTHRARSHHLDLCKRSLLFCKRNNNC